MMVQSAAKRCTEKYSGAWWCTKYTLGQSVAWWCTVLHRGTLRCKVVHSGAWCQEAGPPGRWATRPSGRCDGLSSMSCIMTEKPGHRATVPPGHRAIRPPGHRATGPSGHWAIRPVFWATCTVYSFIIGKGATCIVCSFRDLEAVPSGHRAIGPPGHWATGPPGLQADVLGHMHWY